MRIPWATVLAISIVIAALCYIFGVSWLQANRSPHFRPEDLYIPRLLDVTILLWLFWVGSSIGSFLNVVVWRMPRGQSVNGRSYCPRCRSQLKARDNFPVFGWLALRGRCRTCRLPISSRYPIVEFVVGTSLTIVGVGEIYRISLPFQTLHWHAGPLWTEMLDKSVFLTLIYHTIALALLWGMSLIRMDGNAVPRNLALTAFLLLVVGMVAFPVVMVIPWQMQSLASWKPESGLHVDALMRVLTSLVAAAFYGRCLGVGLCVGADLKFDPLGKSSHRLIDLIVILSVVSIVIGWQSLAGLIVVASVWAYWLRPFLPSRCDVLGRFAVALPIALTLHIFLWRVLRDWRYWPSEGSSPGVLLFSAMLVLLCPLWLREPKSDAQVALDHDLPLGED